ncbi:MAG: hypothetical protein LBI74_04880 [Synergistaceae bacterium]|jgi:hypothetical protein|nr:hypothetical protein [Synergistaceae bacterium]
MNSIPDNSDFSIYREGRIQGTPDVLRVTADEGGSSLLERLAPEASVAEDPRTPAPLDEFESAPDLGLDDKNIYADSLLGRRAELYGGGSAEGPFGENGCRIYMVRNAGGGRRFYFQPYGSGLEVPIGESDGALSGLDVLALSIKIRAAEARYKESSRPYAKPRAMPAEDATPPQRASDGTASASFLPDELYG